ncbi:alkanesulfonate transporter substrate-binding subunit [Peptoniphilus harei]|uniref:TAXI family TRAP transporter solute-binding subunit n=1 Tax=Peptoniphilus harei TaxID=54005 RepID=UPI000F6E0BED|nr:TAXI family TRAP transporter solute-binding subunit [Peptoniphilus harei]MDU1177165.1 TAXI family TRAP transporter solute-binding subunit [Peptoniphilus harei]MDU5417134.1 TAXI family TRAP transporter solute-binding subunit [Peptoniphilus harei]MDU6098199.1 TAXI family TRAP transporter solute-binding subunit [Peptoniphilus harei]QQE46304.1 TAXI family TRAP transporter solute-binding subunit [Peptoniphilus harei]VEJ33542.1 alkanesulfonate transporter substrate-binding subunit [Peptoniphilus 
MTKKKLTMLIMLIAVVSLTLTACGGGGNNAKKENANATKTEETAKTEEATGDITAEGLMETKGGFMSVATGGTGGTYYPLGGALSNILNNAGVDYTATAQATGASKENVELVTRGDAEIAFIQNDVAYYAVNGTDIFEGEKKPSLRGLCCLYPEIVQIVASDDSGIKTIDDLKGKRVAVGAPGSGVEVNVKQILDIHGITYDDLGKVDYLSFAEAADQIKSGQIDATFLTAAIPSSAITELATTHDVHLVPIAEDKAEALIAKYPFYVNLHITPSEYKGQDEEISVVAVQSMLAVDERMAEEDAYNIVKLLFENLDTMKESHARGGDIALDKALDGMSIELHPGAQKYFDEVKK